MPNNHEDKANLASLRNALHQREAQFAMAPPFESIRHRIATTPTLEPRAHWTLRRTLALTIALVWAQIRVVPWLIIPVVIATGGLATLAARFLVTAQNSSSAVSGFASIMLFGVAITLTMAVSGFKTDVVTLVTPLGSRSVLLARVAVVLLVDCIAGFAASGFAAVAGFNTPFITILLSWLVPLTAVAGVVTFTVIWTSPWVATVIAATLIPLVGPRSETDIAVFGLGSLVGVVQDAVTPAGVVGIGILTLTAAVMSARPAVLSSLSNA